MANKIRRVQNDTYPGIQLVITQDGNPLDLTGSTVKLAIQSQTTKAVTNSAHQTCTLTSPSGGVADYTLVAGDLPDAGGKYLCDVQITSATGKVRTYYNYLEIDTRAEIAV